MSRAVPNLTQDFTGISLPKSGPRRMGADATGRTAVISFLNQVTEALASMHDDGSGVRPPYLPKCGLWSNTNSSTNVTKVYQYNGTTDVLLWSIDANGVLSVSGVEVASETVSGIVQLATDVESLAGLLRTKALTPFGGRAALNARIAASVAENTLLVPNGNGGWVPSTVANISGVVTMNTAGTPVQASNGVVAIGIGANGLHTGAVAMRIVLQNDAGNASWQVQLSNGTAGSVPSWVGGFSYSLATRNIYVQDGSGSHAVYHTGNGSFATTGGQLVYNPGTYTLTVPKGHYAAYVICQAGGAGGSSLYDNAYSFGSPGGLTSFGSKVSAIGGSVAPRVSGADLVPGARGVTYGSDFFHEPTPVNWSGKESCDALYWNASGTVNDWRPWGTGGLGKTKSASPGATTRLTAGGAGGYATGVYAVTPGEIITVTVGYGGAGGDRYADGGADYKCPSGGLGYLICVWL